MVLVPVDGVRPRQEILAILDSVFTDDRFAWELGPDDTWTRATPAGGRRPVVHQGTMQRRASARASRAAGTRRER